MTNPRSIGFIVAAKVAIYPFHTKKKTKKFGGIKEKAEGQGFFN